MNSQETKLADEVEDFAQQLARAKLGTATARHAAKLAGDPAPPHQADMAPDPPQAPEARQGRMKSVGGSMSDRFNVDLLNNSRDALRRSAHQEDPSSFVWAAMFGIGPQDELEGMLAAQLVAAHAASMECFQRAMIPDQPMEGREMNLRMANKASRTYAMLLETLDKRRGKGGKQTVLVEHVHRHIHVHEGAEPIVGHIQGGGGRDEKPRKSHAQYALADARQPALRSEDAERQPVPRAGDDERAMQDARGHEPGRTSR